MKTIAFLSIPLFLSDGLAVAFATSEIMSSPFRLLVRSAHPDLDGRLITACPSGSGTEALCVSPGHGHGQGPVQNSIFHLNTTQFSRSPVPSFEPAGKLAREIYFQARFLPLSMDLQFDPATNVAHPVFEPTKASTYVTFDRREGLMAIFSFVDDTVDPVRVGRFVALQRWYVCNTQIAGFVHQSLNWAVGWGAPQNPTCVQAQVVRAFV